MAELRFLTPEQIRTLNREEATNLLKVQAGDAARERERFRTLRNSEKYDRYANISARSTQVAQTIGSGTGELTSDERVAIARARSPELSQKEARSKYATGIDRQRAENQLRAAKMKKKFDEGEITEVTDTRTGQTYTGKQEQFMRGGSSQTLFVGVRTPSQEETRARDNRRNPPSSTIPPRAGSSYTPQPYVDYTPAPEGTGMASFSPDETGRPRYTSAIGFSTEVDGKPAYGEVFITKQTKGVSSFGDIPTAQEIRKQDIARAKKQFKEGEYLDLLTNVQMVGTRQVGGFLERTGEKGSYVQELGEFARQKPEQFTKDFAVSAAIGGATGFVSGKALQAVGSGAAGRFLGSTAGRTFGLATKWGVQSVRQAEVARKISTFGFAGVAAGSVGVAAATGGTEAVARITPSFVGGGLGFAGGFAASGVQFPQLRVLKGSTKTELPQTVKFGSGNVRMSSRGITTTSARFTAYGGGKNIPLRNTIQFRGQRVGGTGRFVGELTSTETASFGKTRFRGRSSQLYEYNSNTGGFSSIGKPQTFSSIAGSQPILKTGAEETRAFWQFETEGSKFLGYRKGLQTSVNTESNLLRFSALKEKSFTGVTVTRLPSFKNIGVQRVAFGESVSKGVTPELGRGTRGRLARSLPEQPNTNIGFRNLFTPRETFGASLGAPVIKGRRGQVSLGRQKPVNVPPETGSIGKGRFGSVPRAGFRQSIGIKPFGAFGFGSVGSGSQVSFLENTQTNIVDTTQNPQDQTPIIDTTPKLVQQTGQRQTLLPALTLTSTGQVTGGDSVVLTPPVTPPPPPTTGGGGFPFLFGLPPSGAASPLRGQGRGFRYKTDFTSSIFNIKGKKKKGVLSGLELRPLLN